MNKQFQAKS